MLKLGGSDSSRQSKNISQALLNNGGRNFCSIQANRGTINCGDKMDCKHSFEWVGTAGFPFSKTSWGVGRLSSREAFWDRYKGQSLVVTERQTVDVKRFDQKKKDFIIDENDIPGAKLPKPIKECTCAVLRRWHLCRGAKMSGKLADLQVRSVLKVKLIILRSILY